MSSPDPKRSEFPYPSLPSAAPVACFSVLTDADPSAVPRVLEVFALRDLTPSRMEVAQRGDGRPRVPENELAIDVQIAGLDRAAAEPIARKLRAIICVRSVEATEKGVPGCG